MGVILDLAPTVLINGGGGSNVDLTEIYQKIGDLSMLETTTKENLVAAINELQQAKAALARVEAIEKYIISLETRLSKIDIEFIDPKTILFID